MLIIIQTNCPFYITIVTLYYLYIYAYFARTELNVLL